MNVLVDCLRVLELQHLPHRTTLFNIDYFFVDTVALDIESLAALLQSVKYM